MTDLRSRSQAPGSALACLDASLGGSVEAGCERSIFSSPETIAAASEFTADRLAVLADALNYAGPRSAEFTRSFEKLKRSVESDRFGLVAKVLAEEEACNSWQCDHLVLLTDPTRVQGHLERGTFDSLVSRHAGAWHATIARSASPAATAAMATSALPLQPSAPTGVPLPADYVLPSSDSIPAISIMNSEPIREKPTAKPAADATVTEDATPAAAAPQRAAQVRPRSKPTGQPPLTLQ